MELKSPAGRELTWYLQVMNSDQDPHRLLEMDWQRLYDFEVVVREATDSDGSALAEIERRTPW